MRKTQNTLCPQMAYLVLSAFHQALNENDIGRALRMCTDRVSYRSNVTLGNAGPLAFDGQTAAAWALARIMSSFDYMAVVDMLVLQGNTGRARVSFVLSHKDTAFALAGSCREMVKYDGTRIAAIEDYTDAPRAHAFFKFFSP